MIRKLQRTQLSDMASVSRMQDEIGRVIDAVSSKPALDHVLVANVPLVAGAVTHVAHGLARAPIGWVLVRKRATADVWDAQDLCRSPSLTLDLHTSANVEVDVLVF